MIEKGGKELISGNGKSSINSMLAALLSRGIGTVGTFFYATKMGDIGTKEAEYFGFICIIFGILFLVWGILAVVSISKTKIKVYEDRIEGAGTCGLGIGTSNFLLTINDQVSIEVRGRNLIVLGPGVRYWVYVKNATEIQSAVFQLKNLRRPVEK